MRIKVSEAIGFCFGVRDAVALSKKVLSDKRGGIFSVGPIIHNPQVARELSRMGLVTVKDASSIKKGTVIISSHGAGGGLLSKKEKGLKVVDATCPFVKKIQRVVADLCKKGYGVVIVGKREHPEVKALVDLTGGRASVVKDAGQARGLRIRSSRIGVVSQSTYSRKVFREVTAVLAHKDITELRIFNTICSDTIRRQDAVRRLAESVDAVLVVGGKNSSNTRRLVEVCRAAGKTAYHIEDSADIGPSWCYGKKRIGVASGASTPDWVVDGVIQRIRRNRSR